MHSRRKRSFHHGSGTVNLFASFIISLSLSLSFCIIHTHTHTHSHTHTLTHTLTHTHTHTHTYTHAHKKPLMHIHAPSRNQKNTLSGMFSIHSFTAAPFTFFAQILFFISLSQQVFFCFSPFYVLGCWCWLCCCCCCSCCCCLSATFENPFFKFWPSLENGSGPIKIGLGRFPVRSGERLVGIKSSVPAPIHGISDSRRTKHFFFRFLSQSPIVVRRRIRGIFFKASRIRSYFVFG